MVLKKKRYNEKKETIWAMTFSKKLIRLCTWTYFFIIVFSCVIMITQRSFESLDTLITETSNILEVGVFGYLAKSGFENYQKIKLGKQDQDPEETNGL